MSDDGAAAEWTWADAWVLAATTDTAEGCSLSELIGTADGTNHAIPTRDELARALGALLVAGLIEHIGERFRTTKAGRDLKKHWKGGLFGWSTTLLPQLQRLRRAPRELALSEPEVQAAYAEYVRRVR
ncbi:MAG: hypothetical protein WAQ75_09315 [Propionicimonas sp.]